MVPRTSRRDAGKMRVVTAREVARQTRELLEEVEETAISLLVLRQNRPVAVIMPRDAFKRPAGVQVAVRPMDDEPDDVPLEPLERSILLLAGDGATADRLHRQVGGDLGALAMALFNLETKRLLERMRGLYRWTARGARLAERLRGEEPP